MKKPDFFIVGAPKCGTTAMDNYLSQHPEIFMSPKELHYFGKDFVFKWPRITEAQYLAYFSKAGSSRRLGETGVIYLYSRTAAREIKNFSPDSQIIVMLRDPVEMLYSLHSQLLFNGDEDIEDFEAALSAEPERKEGKRIPKTALFPPWLYYRDVVKYSDQVQRYFDVFGREKVMVIIFDEFAAKTVKVYHDTLAFLGVDCTYRPDTRIVNPNKKYKSKMLLKMLNDTPYILKRTARLVLPRFVRSRLYENLTTLNTKYTPRKPLDPALKQKLRGEFAPEIDKLSRLLRRDLSRWHSR